MIKDVELTEDRSLDKSLSGYGKHNFSYKVPTPSLAECWKWMKGLLFDFVSLKELSTRQETKIKKANQVIESLNVKIDRLHNYQVYYDTSKQNQQSLKKIASRSRSREIAEDTHRKMRSRLSKSQYIQPEKSDRKERKAQVHFMNKSYSQVLKEQFDYPLQMKVEKNDTEFTDFDFSAEKKLELNFQDKQRKLNDSIRGGVSPNYKSWNMLPMTTLDSNYTSKKPILKKRGTSPYSPSASETRIQNQKVPIESIGAHFRSNNNAN